MADSNFYKYTVSPTVWTDPLGLDSGKLNRNLGGTRGDRKQAHHVIPEEIWGENTGFFNNIGLNGRMDEAFNGILLPDNNGTARQSGSRTIHRGSHDQYSNHVRGRVATIRNNFQSGAITPAQARRQIRLLQIEMRNSLHNGDFNTGRTKHERLC